MEIKVLGPGCKRCNKTEKIVLEAVAEAGVDAKVDKISDLMEIAKYGLLSTPAVVVNGKVKSAGKIPNKKEVKLWLSDV
jgi:small redox-active disulfide protein 2